MDIAANPELLKLPPLDPFRKVRREVLVSINKTRGDEGLSQLSLDYFINSAATQYAEYCVSTERDGNANVLQDILKACGAPGTYKSVSGYRYLEDEEQANAKSMLTKLFLDAYGLTFEINETREEILNPEHTHVGLGLALLNNLYVITLVFSVKPLRLEAIKATEDEKGIEISGKMLTDQLGPYAIRVMDTANPTKPLSLIGPESMKYNLESKDFRILLDKPEFLYANPPFICEIYLRQKPQSIPYEGPAVADLDKNLQYLQLAYKAPMELFPDPRILMEETKDRALEEEELLKAHRIEEEQRQIHQAEREAQLRLWDQGIDQLKEQEKLREAEALGTPYDSYGGSLEGSLSREKSQASAGASDEQKEGKSAHERSASKSSSKSIEDEKKEEEEDLPHPKEGEESKEPAEQSEQESKMADLQERQEREKLERSILVAKEEYARLKKENGDLQHEVATYLQKKELQPSGGDASMNMLKYINALVNVTQVRVQMKQTQESYNKMAQELQEKLQYHQQRSDEMKASFKEFKRAVAESAEFNRTGKKIPKPELGKWEQEEDRVDQELQKERFTYITNKRKLKQIEEELKKKDKLAEGLHVIDFEQLKIENQTLNEKIEERNENIHSLNTKIRKGVITFTHMREKLHQLRQEIARLKSMSDQVKEKADVAEQEKTKAKRDRMKEEIRFQKLRKEVGFLEVNKGGKNKVDSKLRKVGVADLVLMLCFLSFV